MNTKKIFANIVIQLLILLPIQISLVMAAPTISNVQLSVLDNTRVMVNFTTDELADTRVNFGLDENLGMLERSLNLVLEHSLIIGGLNTNTLYYFKPSAQNELGETGEGSVVSETTFETNDIVFVNLTKLMEEPVDTVIIKWETTADSDSILYYGNSSDNLDRFLTGGDGVKEHSITLSGLIGGDIYFYKVKSSYVESSVESFLAPIDITPPVVSYTKPSGFTTESSMNIIGTVDENVTIEMRSNVGVLANQRVEEGEFNITVQFNEGMNRVRFTAVDDYDNSYEDSFNITVDSEAPIITLINFHRYAPFEDKEITIRTDEDAKITIKLNNNTVKEITEFVDHVNETLKIVEEENILEIIAEDEAGNIGNLIETITTLDELILEILAPNITNPDVAKKVGSTYEISVDDTIRIQGRTNPGAIVKIWRAPVELLNVENVTPEYNITANEEGFFSIEIDMPEIATRAEYKRYEDYYTNLGGGTYETYSVEFGVNMKVTYVLRIQAEDEYGRENIEGPIFMKVTKDKCGSSYPWIVDLDEDTHEFKPYRLRDGHELVEFKIGLDWIGLGDGQKINNVIIKTQERTIDMLDNENYDCFTEGEVFPATYKGRSFDDERTYWYLLYKLNAWNGLNDTMIDSWQEAFENLANKKCKLPLKVIIDYDYDDINGSSLRGERQEFCWTQEHHIQDKVDPNMVIPEWLLDGALEFIDASLKALDTIEGIAKAAYDVARWSCYGLLINYAVKKMKVRVRCGRASKSGGDTDGEWDPKDAESCEGQIEDLKILYNRYRFACDRVWCKSAPADPKHGENGIIKGEAITVRDGPRNDECKGDSDFICSQPPYYQYNCGISTPLLYPATDCPEGSHCCRKFDKGIDEEVQMIRDESKVFENVEWWDKGKAEADRGYFIYGKEQWSVDKEDKTWNFGRIMGYGEETSERLIAPKLFVGLEGYAAAVTEKSKAKDLLKGEVGNNSYDTYVSGLHGTSCFNQKPWFDRNRLYLTPSQSFLDSIQCACASDIYGRVQQWTNVLKELRVCLHQIKTVGEAEAGACKALFTQYACDLLTWVAVKGALVVTKGIDATQEKEKDKLPYGEALSFGLGEAVSSFQEDYGQSARLRPDFSMERLTHAVCMFAFTKEWEPGFRGMFNADLAGPPRNSAAWIAPAERELLGANPITGKAFYEYRVGLSFTAGSNIRFYKVELVCDSDGDCPGPPKSRLFKSSPEISNGRITNVGINEFSTIQGAMFVDNADFRYNKVKVTWVSEAGDEYDDSETVDIKPNEDLNIFDCGITPGAALGGNDLLSCGILTTQTRAHFVRVPPARHSITITQENQDVEIPFSIQAAYETAEEEASPLLLYIEEVQSTGSGGTESVPAQRITDGTHLNTDFTMPRVSYSELFAAGRSTITVTKAAGTVVECQIVSKSEGAVPGAGAVTVIFGSTLDGRNIKVIDNGAYGLTSYNNEFCGGNLDACCSGTNCKYDPIKETLDLSIGEAKLILKATPGANCLVDVGAGQSGSQEVKKYYKLSIYKNNGQGGLGPLTYDVGGENEQSHTVEVTFRKGELGSGPADGGDAGLIGGPGTGTVTFYSPFKEYRLESGASRLINSIELTGSFNTLRYYVIDQATVTVQEGIEILKSDIMNNRPIFEIEGSSISNQGVYFLKIQAGNIQGNDPSGLQLKEYQLNVGQGKDIIKKPVAAITSERSENNQYSVGIKWDAYPRISYEVHKTLNGKQTISYIEPTWAGQDTITVLQTTATQELVIKVVARVGTTDIVTSESDLMEIEIPVGSGAGGNIPLE